MDYKNISTLIQFTSRDIEEINTLSGFREYLKPYNLVVEELDSSNFADIPSREVPNNDELYFAKVHFVELRGHRPNPSALHNSIRALYMRTVHGPWIAYELVSEGFSNQVYDCTIGFRAFAEPVDDGYFRCKANGNVFRFSYYPDLNNYFAIVAANREDIENTGYSWNKIIEYFN
ncbi:hypothetical protein [Pontibacter arcticus]|uniref:Uncharacterized protein n=1 Tax=Pontibacter arcticus TaxID=2080288 RepID=A0A364RAM5_9BACT|nr:hypothetical protein [Pontibacter arcticus]RAU81355.1 hypothetical protein DP923_16100 [Pontibacter arcticus]RAU81420.1 hypothetical protein DP923_16445 [Pontibacter arcticus]